MILNIFTWILVFNIFLCIWRIGRGPTAADRAMAIDILGILMVGFTALMTLSTGKDFYMNIAMSWSLLAFIGTIAISKHLEGKNFDD